MISVIVPCYNAEETLREAYDSLPPMSGPNAIDGLQIILADDGSTDGTAGLIARIAKQDPRVTSISMNGNKGVSATRNGALEAATAPFVFFLDADDVVLPGGLGRLLEATAEGIDFVRGKHLLWSPATGGRAPNEGEERNFTETIDVSVSSLPHIVKVYSSWNALFRRDLIAAEGLRFREDMRLGEDREFNLRYLTACRRITFLGAYTHLWRKVAGTTQQATQRLTKDPVEVFLSIRGMTEHARSPFMEANPRHRTHLATAMAVELSNFLASFSKLLDSGQFPSAARSHLSVTLTGLRPEWIDLELTSPKGRIDDFLPLYAEVRAACGQPYSDSFLHVFLKTLGRIRVEMNRSDAQPTAAPGIHRPTGFRDLFMIAFSEARANRDADMRAKELQMLRQARVFDVAYYRTAYPDVAESGVDELLHYIEYGASELRDPTAWFSTAEYFREHPWLIKSGINPLLHYITKSAVATNWTA